MNATAASVRWSLPLRLIAALGGGIGMALVLSLIGAWLVNFFDVRERDTGPLAYEVDVLTGYTQAELRELLGEPRYQLPELEDAPLSLPPPQSERLVQGFVMLEVDVAADGRALDARVVAAAPEGLYEERAVAEALAIDYGRDNAGVRQQVIRFSMPASRVTDPDRP
ncbi:MAG: hypothetical protein AAGF46_03775 [Pseudomonadota bacterium]